MKNLFYVFSFLLTVCMACSNEENLPQEKEIDYASMSESELRSLAAANNAITFNQLMEEMRESVQASMTPEQIEYQKHKAEAIQTKATSPTMSVTGYQSYGRVAENRKVLISSSPSGLVPGYYFCDLYHVKMWVDLPKGTLGVTMDSPNCGFDPNYTGTGRRGCSADGQTGNRFYMLTCAYKVKHDILGREWNIWDPQLHLLVWNYAYIY